MTTATMIKATRAWDNGQGRFSGGNEFVDVDPQTITDFSEQPENASLVIHFGNNGHAVLPLRSTEAREIMKFVP